MTFQVFEVELPADPGNRLLHHIKAASQAEAIAAVEALHGMQSLGCKVWRQCTPKEIAVLEAKAQEAADRAANALANAEWQAAHE